MLSLSGVTKPVKQGRATAFVGVPAGNETWVDPKTAQVPKSPKGTFFTIYDMNRAYPEYLVEF